MRGDTIVQKYLNEKGFSILRVLDQVAQEYNSNPASVSIAWLLARKSITAPIASATSIEQLKELVQAVRLYLNTDTIENLNIASAY